MPFGSVSNRAAAAARRRGGPTLPPELILRDDPAELLEPDFAVAAAECRLKMNKVTLAVSGGKKAQAELLHREADDLFYRGDYESALVLFHRAAKLYPRDQMHLVGAHKCEKAIKAAANPNREAGKAGPPVCPEIIARKARAFLTESEHPIEDIPAILQYFDARQDFMHFSPRSGTPPKRRSKMMVKQLNKCMKSTVKDLETAYESGDAEALRKLSDELVSLVSLTDEPERNRVDAYAYLAEKQMAAGRHDRAIDLASRMFFLARTNGDVVAMVEALATLGKVHIKFGHLRALVQVWERLKHNINQEPIPKAWLHHDIGRVYLELGEYSRALEAARVCISAAESVNSRKWKLRGHLLCGLCLLKLENFTEGVAALKSAAQIADEEENPLLHYIQDIIDNVADYLRRLYVLRQQGNLPEPPTRREATREAGGGGEVCLDLNKLEQEMKAKEGEDEEKSGDLYAELENPAKEEASRTQQPEALEDTSEAARRARLLEKTRMLRAALSEHQTINLITAPLVLPDDEYDDDDSDTIDDEEKVMPLDTSRTRIIERANFDAHDSEDERTFRPGELQPLSDISCLEDDFTSARLDDEDLSNDETARGLAVNSECSDQEQDGHEEAKKSTKPLSLFPLGEEVPAPRYNFNPSLEKGEEADSSSDSEALPERKHSLSDYLRSLQPRDFVELELEQEGSSYPQPRSLKE